MLFNHMLCHPFLLLPSIFPSITVFSDELTLHQVTRALQLQLLHQPSNEYSRLISFRIDWLISLQYKGLSRVFPAAQFKSISSSTLSLLYGPTLTSIHDYWKNCSFDSVDFCRQSAVSAFEYTVYGLSELSFQGASVF